MCLEVVLRIRDTTRIVGRLSTEAQADEIDAQECCTNPQRLCSHLDDHSLTYSVRTWTNEILTSLAVAQKHRVNGHPMIAQLIASDYP
jgi:hypothetical protein